MEVNTLIILISVVLLFTLSVGIILGHRNSKSSSKINVRDCFDDYFKKNFDNDDEII